MHGRDEHDVLCAYAGDAQSADIERLSVNLTVHRERAQLPKSSRGECLRRQRRFREICAQAFVPVIRGENVDLSGQIRDRQEEDGNSQPVRSHFWVELTKP